MKKIVLTSAGLLAVIATSNAFASVKQYVVTNQGTMNCSNTSSIVCQNGLIFESYTYDNVSKTLYAKKNYSPAIFPVNTFHFSNGNMAVVHNCSNFTFVGLPVAEPYSYCQDPSNWYISSVTRATRSGANITLDYHQTLNIPLPGQSASVTITGLTVAPQSN